MNHTCSTNQRNNKHVNWSNSIWAWTVAQVGTNTARVVDQEANPAALQQQVTSLCDLWLLLPGSVLHVCTLLHQQWHECVLVQVVTFPGAGCVSPTGFLEPLRGFSLGCIWRNSLSCYTQRSIAENSTKWLDAVLPLLWPPLLGFVVFNELMEKEEAASVTPSL